MKIGFIGMGNMGSAIAGGISSFVDPGNICFYSLGRAEMEELSRKTGYVLKENNIEVVKDSKYIILAIKPQIVKSIADEIKSSIKDDNVLISLLPGVSISELSEMFCTNRIVRSMPNTPALIGEGMTGVSFDEKNFTPDETDEIGKIFSSFGSYRKVDEELMNAVVCASGSSPAYVFMFIEALADSVVKLGMPRDMAYDFVSNAVSGSAKLVSKTKKHPAELKDMVCSPKGTTIAAVEALEKNGMRKALFEATNSCYEKCVGIGK